jgi:adenosylcobinamide kinase/adenosylcobinamide-phosphate guanylyltransferase
VRRLALIGGGARSGKSAFALRLARAMGRRRAFIATAQAFDDEMRDRIARHVEERGDAFRTLEAPLDLPGAIDALRDVDVAVVDCLTLWLSNLLLRGDDDVRVAGAVDALGRALSRAAFPVVVVTNEVGMGIVPETPLGRRFRDVAGRAHQRLAAGADAVYVAMMGCIVRLRPAPVALEEPAP